MSTFRSTFGYVIEDRTPAGFYLRREHDTVAISGAEMLAIREYFNHVDSALSDQTD